MRVVATAGHVDHGKSTLVLALTGTDPDRFAEEKARGLTIDLGFAQALLPSGQEIGFVDVPGHVRFLKNMLAGVGAVDACLFVVAATEGWKPQSEEHLRILELLGVTHGVVALTKVGLVDDDHRTLAAMDVADHLAGTFLAGAEVVAVDAVASAGLDDLRSALEHLVAATPAADDRGRPRLWVDRSFAARGAGTVVTGTLAGGGLTLEDEVLLLPAGRTARVRGLQTHAARLEHAGPGRRLAVNLAGVAHDQVARGDALVRPDQWHSTRVLDATLDVLASLDHDVSRRGAYLAYLGSGEHPVRLRVVGGGQALPPGGSGLVRLHLPVALPLLPGDRYVLRESGRSETVGGGEILDVDPVRPATTGPARPLGRPGGGGAGLGHAGHARAPDRGAAAAPGGRLRRGPGGPGRRPWPRSRRPSTPPGPSASTSPRSTSVAGRCSGCSTAWSWRRAGPGGRRRRTRWPATPTSPPSKRAPFAPPPPDGVDRTELRELVRRGLVVERDGVWFAPSAVARAAEVVAGLLAETPDGVTASQVRDALGTTRKYLLPLLGVLDATGSPAAGATSASPDPTYRRRPERTLSRSATPHVASATKSGWVRPGRRPPPPPRRRRWGGR